MTSQEPEPSGWELMRGLRDLKDEVSKIGGRVVPIDVYNADKQGTAERFVRLETRMRDREAEALTEKKDAEKARADLDKQRRQNQFSVAIAVFVAVLSLVGGLVLRSIP